MPCPAHSGRLRAMDRRAPTPSPAQRRMTAALRRLIEARQVALLRRVAGQMRVRVADAEPVPEQSVQRGVDLLRIMLSELDQLCYVTGAAVAVAGHCLQRAARRHCNEPSLNERLRLDCLQA